MAEIETKKKKPMKPRGFKEGHEKFGGRKPGSLNRKHLTAKEEVEKHLGGRSLMDVYMDLANDAFNREDYKLAQDCYKSVLPYVYPKLNATTIKLDDSNGDVKERIDEMANKLLGISSERPKE